MLFSDSIKHPIMFNLASGSTDIEGLTTSINRCIGLLFTTGKGELLGDPDFGCGLYELLFDQYSTSLESQIKNEIADSIKKYERRVVIDASDISIEHIENSDRNSYRISIRYDISGTTKQGKTSITMEERDSQNG